MDSNKTTGNSNGVTAITDWLHSLLDFDGVSRVLDIGCGKGQDLSRIGRLTPGATDLVGMDSSANAIEAAAAEAGEDSRFRFMQADASEKLPFEDGAFDVVFSRNFLECVLDKDALLREVHRLLAPGGQVLFAHWDWDSQLVNGSDKDLVRRIMLAYADWQQPWMGACDSWMGRRLWGVFNRSRLFSGSVQCRMLVETEFAPGGHGYSIIKTFEALVRNDIISAEDYQRFIADLEKLSETGEYCYSTAMFAFVGRAL